MADKYDIVVIGAGMGGLSAATMLAKNGLKVLLLERHHLPGGYATSFIRGRFEFEVALHELSGVGIEGDRGRLFCYLEDIGVTDMVEFITVPNLYRTVMPGLELTVPAGLEPFETTLCEAFPSQADGIQKLLKRVIALRTDVDKAVEKGGVGHPLLMPFRLPHLFRYFPSTWGDVLNRDVADPTARAVLSQYWSYIGLPPSQASFYYFALVLAAYILKGVSFPKGRSQALSSAFVESFEKFGGEIMFNCDVKKIVTNNGRVTGIVTSNEQEFQTSYVISNVDPIATCKNMIGLENIPRKFFRELRTADVSPSTVNVYLGIDKPIEELGLREHEVFVNPDHDLERHYQSISTLNDPEAISITGYNSVYPEISPPGTSVVALTSLSYGEAWRNLKPSEYVETKSRIGEAMITVAKTVAPTLMDRAEEMDVSTPLTNARYTRNTGGAIYGFSQSAHNNLALRMDQIGPVDGLYFAGAWTKPGGGFAASIFSGADAGELIVQHRRSNKRGR